MNSSRRQLRQTSLLLVPPRVTVTNPQRVREAKRALRTAFRAQLDGLGFSLVEVLSTCPTRWSMNPGKALEWVEEHMVPYYPVQEFVVADALREKK